MDTVTVRATVTGHIKFGWSVAPIRSGVVGTAVRSGSVIGKTVAFTWDGRDAAGKPVPDGTYRITVWAADVSNNRASVAKVVTVDRRPSVVRVAAVPASLSPNGDGQTDSAILVMRTDEAITGTARIIDRTGATVRRWSFNAATVGDWTWNGRDAAGATVADGRYLFRVRGLDRAGNQTVRDLTVLVDRTIKSLTWAHPSFVPTSGQTDRATLILHRPATVTRRDLPGDDPGAHDLERAQPRHGQSRLDVERQDGSRGAGQARQLSDRGRCHELDRTVAPGPRYHGQGPVASSSSRARLDRHDRHRRPRQRAVRRGARQPR